jgi:4'-phosphopantetheinyl transferase
MLIEIHGVKINESIPEDMFRFLLMKVSTERQKKAMSYHSRIDALRCIVGELIIRKIIYDKYQVKNQSIIFTQNEYGKPFLTGSIQFPFNISHSGKWVVCGLSQRNIGIDIELIQPTNYLVARRFFTSEEVNQLFILPEPQRMVRFYSLWTAKESYIKAIGQGMAIPLNSFEIYIDPITSKQRVSNNTFSNISIEEVPIDPNYMMTVCLTEDVISHVELHTQTLLDFSNFII